MNTNNSLVTCLGLAIVAGLVLCACSTVADTPPSPSPTPVSHDRVPSDIRAMWVWRESWFNTDQAQNELLDFCQHYGFNRIFVQIHEDKQAAAYTIKYPAELTQLIAQAADRGIAVEALDGAKDMAMAANHARTLEILDAIIDLNQSMPEGKRFVGIHYDIEPYIMSEWKQDQDKRQVIMRDLLDYYTKARQKLNARSSNMLLVCDIPMWYDRKTDPDDNCILDYNGQTQNLHQHIQDICDYIGIMSYRTHAVGPNSITEHVANELAYAEKIGKKICASMETIELDKSPQITFYGLEPEEFWKQFNLVQQAHADRPGYAGMLVHSYRGLRDLLPAE